ncbi:Rgp1-domain-containing protein [Fimicolochytrium jonesii]|uniref:Rgp1-domain-containing protein n=1 Tax=Fimicolochytrium jonesii TaxID=1396493 RepID=UPI0022FE4504|nr:Rgp1-domain-containing protein [Fimicolochytrium jonesii]KAI8823519.1 Rgp1-domain-containing protein [Fimicolochytrium jonesii]
MVVLLTAKLGDADTGRDGVFYAGEKFVCHLTFSNKATVNTPARLAAASQSPLGSLAARNAAKRTPGHSRNSSTGQNLRVAALKATTMTKSTSDLDLQASFGESVEDNELGSNPVQQPVKTSEGAAGAPEAGSAEGQATQSSGLTGLLRRSLSLTSIRSAVGTTLSILGTPSDTRNSAFMHSMRDISEHNHAQDSTQSSAASTPQGHLSQSPTRSPPLRPFLNRNDLGPPTTQRVSLHMIGNDVLKPLPASLLDQQSDSGTLVQSDSFGDMPSAYSPLPLPRGLPEPTPMRGSAPSPHGAKYEKFAWAYAQLTGEFWVDAATVKITEFESLKSKAMYRPAGAAGGGGTMGVAGTTSTGKTDRSASDSQAQTFPVLSTPPSIMFTDLVLDPGESKTYKFEFNLPQSLPPSHRGKFLRISYKLIVGVQRGGITHKSQVISLPFRMFNFVRGDGSRPLYGLTSPAAYTRDEASIVVENEHSDLDRQANSNQASLLDKDDINDCLSRTISVCMMSRKVSYDICKNTDNVAKLTLNRNVYRLGETLMGILNFSNSTIPCFRVSAFLESKEYVDEAYGVRPVGESATLSRRVYAEQHKFTLNHKRIGIDLFVPNTSTGDFETSAVALRWSLRLEFITGTEKQLHLQSSSNSTFIHTHAIPTAKVEAFDCIIPLRVYGMKSAAVAQPLLFEII